MHAQNIVCSQTYPTSWITQNTT